MTSTTDRIAILLNGPKYCGKDTAASALLEVFGPESAIFRFTVPVKEETHRRYGLSVPYDHFEGKDVKDAPLPEFGGLSPREAYIKVGDELRAEHGPDIVTRMLCGRIRESDLPIVINPDCGGDAEAEGIAAELGADRVIVLRIHKDGHDYRGDSRNWVVSPGLRKIDIVNVDGKVVDYLATVREIGLMFRDSVLGPAAGARELHAEARFLLRDRPKRFG